MLNKSKIKRIMKSILKTLQEWANAAAWAINKG